MGPQEFFDGPLVGYVEVERLGGNEDAGLTMGRRSIRR